MSAGNDVKQVWVHAVAYERLTDIIPIDSHGLVVPSA